MQLKDFIFACFEQKLIQIRINGTEESLMYFSETMYVLLF